MCQYPYLDRFCKDTRLVAWALIQALLLSQILPPFANAQPDHLKVQATEEAKAKAGLEEALVTQPARGFTTRVDQAKTAEVQKEAAKSRKTYEAQVAKRAEGRLVATGTWDVETGTIGDFRILSGMKQEEISSVDRVSTWVVEGLQWLAAHQKSPAVGRVWQHLAGKKLAVEFRADHALTLDIAHDGASLVLDATVAGDLGDSQYDAGRKILYGMGIFFEAAQAIGYQEGWVDPNRAAIHQVLGLYEKLSPEEREQLHGLLASEYVDHGGIWDFFFGQATDDTLFQASGTREQRKLPEIHLTDKGIGGVDTETLREQRDEAGQSKVQQERLDWVVDFRDTWASWLIGMLQFDIPFDYQAFMRNYRDSSIDLDTKRRVLFRIVEAYSKQVEEENARRVARDAAERGQILVGGRFSTAFGDQIGELNVSSMVQVTNEMREAAVRLEEAVRGIQEKAGGDPDAERAAGVLVRTGEGLLTTVLKAGGVTEAEVMQHVDPEEHAGWIYGALEKYELWRMRAIDNRISAAESRPQRERFGPRRGLDKRPFEADRQAVHEEVKQIRGLTEQLRDALGRAPKQAYARTVSLQRISSTGSINFAYGIGFAHRPGQAPNLRERLRVGGQQGWMSPDLSWVEWVNFLVEFIPLFIGERILRYELPDGRQVERREIEVDQKGLEAAIRRMADAFAANIERTAASEYVALAREAVLESRLGSQAIDQVMAQHRVDREEAYRIALRGAPPSQKNALFREVAVVACALARRADKEEEQIQQQMVDEWDRGNQLSRYDLVRERFLFREGVPQYGKILEDAAKALDPERDAQALRPYREEVPEKRRPLPVWVMGTTEAPGLTEGFILGWLEEEMALRNVIRAAGHEKDVEEKLTEYRRLLVEVGRVVLREFGYERRIDSTAAEQEISQDEAVLELLGENELLQREVGKLAVLRRWASQTQPGYSFEREPDSALVLSLLERPSEEVRRRIDREARRIVWEQNRSDLQAKVERAMEKGAADFEAALKRVIETEEVLGRKVYQEHFESARRWVARDLVVQDLRLGGEVNRWYRDHRTLAKTTARQKVVDEFNLRGLMTDPRHNYRSDGAYLDETDQWVPSPRNMWYLAIYGPSQVDLGGEATSSKQLKSIKIWPQWVGVLSRPGEEAAHRFYGAYHYRVEIRRLAQAEDMKNLKNARTAMGRAVMNLIAAVTLNDVQDVALQTRTHGDPLADMFAYQEPDKPGATAGYCIPKDILFKVFASKLQDAAALRTVGIPEAQIPDALALARQIWAQRRSFASEMEWERWATGDLIRFNQAFKNYIDLGERGVLIFNVTRIAKMLDRLGMPSAFPGFTRDLYRALQASVAADRIADLEAVNRATALGIPIAILDAVDYAANVNPGAELTPPQEISVQLPAPYKYTGWGAGPLADVRYSRTVGIAHVFSALPGVVPEEAGLEERPLHDAEAAGQRLLEPLTASLRPQDEALLYLGLRGFRPESTDPVDQMVTRFVAERMLGVDRRSVETDPGFVQARKEIDSDAPDYWNRLDRLVTEWIVKTVATDPAYAQQVTRLREERKPKIAPGQVTITASPQTAVADVLGYMTEKEVWERAADEAMAILQANGLSPEEIRARARSRDPFPRWIEHLPEEKQQRIREQGGGRFIPLAIREGGLGADFWLDIQGKDVVVFGGPYDATLNANPAHIIQSMRRNNPRSRFVIDDHAVQGRPRVWHGHREWAPDLLLAFAAGLGYDKEGRRITDWHRRVSEGRRVVYIADSLPPGSPVVESWRRKELEIEGRVIPLYDAMEELVNARGDETRRRRAVDKILGLFRRQVKLSVVTREYEQVSAYEREVGPDGLNLLKPRDRAMAGALGSLVRGMNEALRQQGDPALWLGYATRAEMAALGLMFLLNGEDPEQIQSSLETVDQALQIIRQELESRGLTLEMSYHQPIPSQQARVWTDLLIVPRRQIEISPRGRRAVEVSSVKAPETVSRKISQRAASILQAEREVHLSRRAVGYRQVMEGLSGVSDLEVRWERVQEEARLELEQALAALSGADPSQVHFHTGRLLAWMQVGAHALLDLWVEKAQERLAWHEKINALTQGRELNTSAWRIFVDLHGLLPRLFELTAQDPQGRQAVGRLMGMAHAALAMEKMSPYLTLDRAFIQEPTFWLDLLDFFQTTLNDHLDQRFPWAFSPARGTGLKDYFDPQERLLPDRRTELDLYAFAWENHRWLYRFLRTLIVSKTQLADWAPHRQDQLLGRVFSGEDLVPAIGGGAPLGDEAMQRWRGYLQLREVANWCQTSVAMLQDTFRTLSQRVGPVEQAMMPYVFVEPVDPQLFGAQTGAGLVILSGIGRPHYQYLLREGSALGDNIFITQHGRFLTPEGREPRTQEDFDRAVLWIDDAHFWVSLDTFRKMLMEVEGLTESQADDRIGELRRNKQIHPKGVRVAARFRRPVAVGAAVTLHGHYLGPALSRARYPTTDKSQVLFETTYGKIYGPAIVQGSDLHYPFQVNVYQEDTLQAPRLDRLDQVRQAVGQILAGMDFPTFFSKGSRESGSRNLRDFDASAPQGEIRPDVVDQAVRFTYDVSTGQDVVLSEDVSLTNSDQTFLTTAMVQHVRTRAIREFKVDVDLNQPGKHDVTTVRVTATSPRPEVPYRVAHALMITSFTGKATNIARQNVAEPLRPEFLQPEIRDQFLADLMTHAPKGMEALADFTRRFWHEGITLPDGRQFPAYREEYRREYGEYPPEFDARGVPYWFPTWLMIDFVPAGQFADVRNGAPLTGVRLVDIEPGDPVKGTSPTFWLEDAGGNRMQGKVIGHVPWLLEWNVGVGQVPEYNRREEYWEHRRAQEEAAKAGEPERWFERIIWDHVGQADRVVLNSWLTEARELRSAKGFPSQWPEAPVPPEYVPGKPSPETVAVTPMRLDPLAAALRGVRAQLGSMPVTENTLSLWLRDYAFRMLSGNLAQRRAALQRAETYQETAHQVAGDVLTLLGNGQLLGQILELARSEGISLDADRVGNLLTGMDPASQEYRERIAMQVLGDFLAEPQTAIPVAVIPFPLSPAQVSHLLNQPNTLAVVVGKELKMDHAVEPFALSAVGRAVNVVGIHTDWLNSEGAVTRLAVVDLSHRICWECSLSEPMRLKRTDHATAVPRAYIVDLPQKGEIALHQEVARRLRAGGMEPINPSGEAQKRADDKVFLLAQQDQDRVHWTLIPRQAPDAQVRGLVDAFAARHPGERLVIKPRADTTGAQGVEVIPAGETQVDQAVAAVGALQLQGHDVLLQRFWGNVTFGGQEFVLRSHITGDAIQSEYILVAPFGQPVVSINRGARAQAKEEVMEHLIGPQGPVSVSPERMRELDEEAIALARLLNRGVPLADQLGLIALDRRFWVDEKGQLHQVVLEANARGGGLIVAEPAAVSDSFWTQMRLAELPSLSQWEQAFADEAQAREVLGPRHYPEGAFSQKRLRLRDWNEKLDELRTPTGEPAFHGSRATLIGRIPWNLPYPRPDKFRYLDPSQVFLGPEFTGETQPTHEGRMPGRIPYPPGGRHLDYIGGQGDSMGTPTLEEVVAFVQVVDGMDGQVELYVVDAPAHIASAYPQRGKGPRAFNLRDREVSPDRRIAILDDWDQWAQQVTAEVRLPKRHPDKKINYGDDLVALTVAVLRTEFGDPSGKGTAFFQWLLDEGKGIRIALASDLSAEGGVASSSSVLESAAQAFNVAGNLGLDVAALVKLGYGERFYAGTAAGVKDHSHFMYDLALLGVAPTRLVTQISPFPGYSVVLFDSGIHRDNAPQHSQKLSPDERDPNHERNIKARTGIGYALGALWIRKNHPELAEILRPGQDPTSPYGFLRELMPGAERGLSLRQIYEILRQMPEQGLSPDELRAEFADQPQLQQELEQLLAKVSVQPERYPIREMALFFFAEGARNGEAVRLLRQLGQGIPVEELFREYETLVHTGHNGDRVVRHEITGELTDEALTVVEQPWDWRMTNDRLDGLMAHADEPEARLALQPGWMERSIEPLDLLVDLIQFFDEKNGGGIAVAEVFAAGLGGAVGGLVRNDMLEPLFSFLEKHYFQRKNLTHRPHLVAVPGKAAGVFTLPSNFDLLAFPSASAGLEEKIRVFQEYFKIPEGWGESQLWMWGMQPVERLIEIVHASDLTPGDEVWVLGAEDGRFGIPAAALTGARVVLVEMDGQALPILREAVEHFQRLGFVGPNQVRVIPGNLFRIPIEYTATFIFTSVGGVYNPDGDPRDKIAPAGAFPDLVAKIQREAPHARVAFHWGAEEARPPYYEQAVASWERMPISDAAYQDLPVDFFRIPAAGAVPSTAGLEEWMGPIDAGRWVEANDPLSLIQSFSRIRAVVGENEELSPAQKMIFARYGYLFGRHQIGKFLEADPAKKSFTFVLGRDPRPSGRAILEAQIRGILVAAEELGVDVQFRDGGILPTPFVEALVRATNADGGVIMTASHNPLEWNGVKYPTAANEPGGALVSRGILLPAREMSKIVGDFRQWAEQVSQNIAEGERFRSGLNRVDPTGKVEGVDPEVALNQAIQEARQMWGLEDVEASKRFRQRAQAIKIVLDPNGGAAAGHYRRFLEAFGFTVIEINNTVGQPHHGLEPVGDALADAKQALSEHQAHFAVVFDYDADRGNTLILDSTTGQASKPNPQEVAAMNVAMALARRHFIRQQSGDTRPLAVVVHDATSRRVREIARVFGAQVFVVVVGEVNVLEKMRGLEKDGYDVPIGIEGANGGTVFRGDHPEFQGDTSRNGAMTALFTGMVAMDPEIGRTWLEARNQAVPKTVPKVEVPQEPTLVDLLNSMPGERGQEKWRFFTPIWDQGKRREVPDHLIIPFKLALEKIWYDRLWPRIKREGLGLGGGPRKKFQSFSIRYHAETEESPEYGPRDRPYEDRLNQMAKEGVPFGRGGWILELRTARGQRAFVWLRGSMTEGFLRISTEGQGSRAEKIAQALRDLIELEWYPQALRQARSTTGLEEEIPLPAGALGQKLVILTPDTVEIGIQALAGLEEPPGEILPLAVIVSGDLQEQQVTAGLEEVGLTLAMPIRNLARTGWTLPEAIVDVQVMAWSAGLEETFVVQTFQDLPGLGDFLGISQRSWEKRLERLGTASQA